MYQIKQEIKLIVEKNKKRNPNFSKDDLFRICFRDAKARFSFETEKLEELENYIRDLVTNIYEEPEQNYTPRVEINSREVNPRGVDAEKFKSISAKELLNLDVHEFPTLLNGVLPMQGIAALGGASDVGKSFFGLQLCLSVTSELEDFLGFKLNVKHKRAWYVSTEDDMYSMSFRIGNLKPFLSSKELEQLRFVFDIENLIEHLDKVLAANPASLVVLDAFADLFDAGELNDAIAVRKYITSFKQLALKHECLFLFIHHCGKQVQYKVPQKDNLLGSQGFESSMRVVMELRQDPVDLNIRHLCIVKGNNLNSDLKHESFELSFDVEKGFVPTGKRVEFENLIQKHPTGVRKISDNLIKRIAEYHNEKVPGREITRKLRSEGISISNSTVAEIIKSLKK